VAVGESDTMRCGHLDAAALAVSAVAEPMPAAIATAATHPAATRYRWREIQLFMFILQEGWRMRKLESEGEASADKQPFTEDLLSAQRRRPGSSPKSFGHHSCGTAPESHRLRWHLCHLAIWPGPVCLQRGHGHARCPPWRVPA